MADIFQTSHTNLMDMRAKGKKLHRRTQSSSKHDLNGFFDKKAASEEFTQEMIQSNNVLNADATQHALDADANKFLENEKEVIVDDIEDIPFTGIIVPKANSAANPLNLVSKGNLTARIASLNSNIYPVKKVHLLDQLKDNIDEFTGLNTIHEKKNSMDSMDTENLGARSPDLLSICNSQGSKNPSRTHSKHSSLDIRPGHSKTSSADLRNVNFNQPIFDFRSLNQSIKAEKENLHFSKRPSNFSNPECLEPFSNTGPAFGISSSKRAQHGRTQPAAHNNYMNKIPETNITSPKTQLTSHHASDTISPKNSTFTTLKSPMDKSLKSNTKSVAKKLTTNTTTTTNTKEAVTVKEAQKIVENKPTVDQSAHNVGVDNKLSGLSESMKNLTDKTDMLENQIKSLFQVVESFNNEKSTLEEKVKVQDGKIKTLMDMASKYEEEIKSLKTGRTQKDGFEENTKIGSRRLKENPGATILTTTDVSSIESPGSDSSGFYTGKDAREISKTLSLSSTSHGYKGQANKNERMVYEPHATSKRAQGIKGKKNGERN